MHEKFDDSLLPLISKAMESRDASGNHGSIDVIIQGEPDPKDGSGIPAMMKAAEIVSTGGVIFGGSIQRTIGVTGQVLVRFHANDALIQTLSRIADSKHVRKIWVNSTENMLNPIFDGDIESQKKIRMMTEKAVKDGITWSYKRSKYPEMLDNIHLTGKDVVVGILDTGLDINHPEFGKERLVSFKDFHSARKDCYDDNGHGTHCASTIGGARYLSDSNYPIIGAAPECKFVVGKILGGDGSGDLWSILEAMVWIANPTGRQEDIPRVVSNSWGANGQFDIFKEAINFWRTHDILPVFAAGNSGPNQGTVGTPGYHRECLTVGAMNSQDKITWFSSRGPGHDDAGVPIIKPDVVAGGQDILGAKPGGQYMTISGTSMATPHVAGLAALLFEKDPSLSANLCRSVIEANAEQLRGYREKNNDSGYGLIDFEATTS